MARAEEFARKYTFYLKLDIRKYFDSIDHAIMLTLLSKRIKDADVIELFSQILKTYHTKPGKGVPIGNLISQHLANFYLGHLDHWVKEVAKIKGYLRYMDDFILFSDQKSLLKTVWTQIQNFLTDELALTLKYNVQLNQTRFGVPFLGFRVFPNHIRLSPRSPYPYGLPQYLIC